MKKFRQWLRNFLGISEVLTRLHNMDGDIMCYLEKQANPLMTLPVDAPECNENLPHEYRIPNEFKTETRLTITIHQWYCIWMVGFAGPFSTEKDAYDYAHFNKINGFEVEKLAALPFEIKK